MTKNNKINNLKKLKKKYLIALACIVLIMPYSIFSIYKNYTVGEKLHDEALKINELAISFCNTHTSSAKCLASGNSQNLYLEGEFQKKYLDQTYKVAPQVYANGQGNYVVVFSDGKYTYIGDPQLHDPHHKVFLNHNYKLGKWGVWKSDLRNEESILSLKLSRKGLKQDNEEDRQVNTYQEFSNFDTWKTRKKK